MEIEIFLAYAVAFFSLFTVNVFLLIFFRHKDDCSKPLPPTTKRPFISIIVPAYNEEKHLDGCIQSILSVNYPKNKLEILIIDDGSKDRTEEIARKYEKENSSLIKVYKKENEGKAVALNFGLEKAKGELVATMDADSYLTSNTLIEMLPYFEDKEVMAVTPAVKIKSTGAIIREFQRVEYLLILFSRKILSFIDAVPVTPGPCSLFRAEVFKIVGGFDKNNLVEDQEIALRIQSHNFKIQSSLTAEVFTEPPESMGALIKQRVRWQRGGVRNYWKYRFLIKPQYGDFGLYFVPMNYLTLAAFFLSVILFLRTFFTTPYYSKYIVLDLFGFNTDLFSFVTFFVTVATTLYTYISVKNFKEEKVNPLYVLTFMFFYWYLMFFYNVIGIFKEITKAKDSW